MSNALHKPIQNRLLAALPEEDYQHLVTHLECVELSSDQVLHEHGEPIDYVYFPLEGVISLVNIMSDGWIIEVGLVGQEGIVGTARFLGSDIAYNTATVQVPGSAMRMKASVLKAEFNRGGQFQNLLLRYMQALFIQVSQSAACNRHHTVEKRLARWLLLASDAIESDQLPLTQEFIAQMLGTRRSGVTAAAGTLSQAGLIRYSRGKIAIVNREELEATSCECYSIVKNELARLLGGGSG